jgi:hypothetical protein
MSVLRIYADFNGLVAGCRNPDRTAVVLDTFGTLRDLCNAGVILSVDLPLIAVDWSDETEDLEGHGTAQFDTKNQWWVVEFDELGVRHVRAGSRDEPNFFLCVSCRFDLRDLLASADDAFSRNCPSCGTPIRAPLDPPSTSGAHDERYPTSR